MMREDVVLCAANAYHQKYYLNPEYGNLPEDVQKELIWKAEVRALAEITDKCKYCKSSAIKGYCSNDRSFALRHLRILYGYQIEHHQDMYGTRIHNQINANYRMGMLDYYKNE